MIPGEARGVVHGRTVILADDAPEIPKGPKSSSWSAPRAARQPHSSPRWKPKPHLTAEDVDELERKIAAGRRPRTSLPPFENVANTPD